MATRAAGSSQTTVSFFHTDLLGSVRVTTNSGGNSTGTCDYEPFGEVQTPGGCTIASDYRFAGMRYDAESGLYHTWFRQYDPNQGRWMGVDPLAGSLANPQSLNRYAYTRNDPANLVDPLGLRTYAVFRCV